MVPADGNVITLRSAAIDRAEARALFALRELVAEIDDALAAVADGDVDSVFRVHQLAGRAMKLVLDHRLATPASWTWTAGQ